MGATEGELRVSEARFRTLFDHVQIGVVIAGTDSVYLDANPAACRMLGYTRDELIGRHASDIVVGTEVAHVETALTRTHGHPGHRREWQLRRRDGSIFSADVNTTALPDGTQIGMIADVTPLRNEQQFSDTMIESMPGVLYFYDVNGRFLRWNRNFETVSGYRADEIARMHPLDFFRDADRDLVAARIGEVFEQGESSVEATFVARDGTTKPFYFTGRRVTFDGRPCLVGVGMDISARLETERRLADSEQQYRELVEYANSIILRWTAGGRITFLNEFGQRFFGYTAPEIIGRLVTETIVPAIDTGGQDLRALIDSICAAPEEYEENVNENVRRNGERVWIAWTNRIVRNAAGDAVEFLSVGVDVTERRRAAERLRDSEAHLREAQRIARIGSWELDPAADRLTWSDQTCELFGVERSAFEGTFAAFAAFVHPDDRARRLAAQQAVLAGHQQIDLEYRIVLRDGTEKVVHELGTLKTDAVGRPLALAGTVHDITDRVRAETERRMRHQAEAADRIKSAFLATMSHELRTPLNSIIGFTGIVLQGLAGPLTAEQSKQLGMVRSSARHLLALVNDVLDISKIEAGQFEVASEPFDLDAALAHVQSLVAPQIAARELTMRVAVPERLGTAIGDRRRFEQILLNLVSNAIKFTPQGEVAISAGIRHDVAVPGRPEAGPAIVVGVSDTGIGIRAEDLPSLFQPFTQIDSGLARQHDGTGLGLAISRRLAELMGGEVRAESEWGHGSTFTLVLPLTRAAAA